MGVSAQAADIYEPPVIVEPPVYHHPEVKIKKIEGWYIRGDLGYAWNEFRGAIYATPGGTNHLFGDLDQSFILGGGIGYQINHYLRTDVTVDYTFKTDFEGFTIGECTPGPVTCQSSDTSGFDAWTVLANAYIDLGHYGKVTPYVGAGIGGSYVRWHDLENTIDGGFDQDGTVIHEGKSSWRFAYALMAGVSIKASKKLSVDLGYRFRKTHQGAMFGFADDTGPGWDNGFESHEIRAGLRYKLGGHHKKHKPVHVPVHHPAPVVYK